MDWSGRSVVVTGGSGFLGSHVVDRLRDRGAEVYAFRAREYDLRDASSCAKLMADAAPSVVIHCAVDGGGIGYMRQFPASVYTNNVRMNTNLIHAAYEAGVEKLVGVSSVCAYPRDTPIPMREEDLWSGYPEPSNAAYGISKRMMMEQGLAYQQQYGFRSVFPMPVNLYGPRDDFHPRRSHVVPALIKKCLEAKERRDDHIVAWGTGRATRELLYVEDCADAILAAAERLESPEPVNVGNGREVSIRELIGAIAAACGFEGEIRWDTSKPDGQPRKCLDLTRCRERLDWEARVTLEEGLARTVDWYLRHRDRAERSDLGGAGFG